MTTADRSQATREIASWRQLKMWLDGESLQSAVTVKLIGVHEGKSLLVTSPDETQLYLREGRLYRFRSFSGEFVYEFVSPLIKVCTAPFPYLHIGWAGSRQVEKRNLRAARRVRTDLQCMVYPGQQANGRFAKGLIHDLSTAGAAITLQDELAVFYDEVRVVFRVQVADQEVLIEARARAVRKPEAGCPRSDPRRRLRRSWRPGTTRTARLRQFLARAGAGAAAVRVASLVYAIGCADRTCTRSGTVRASREPLNTDQSAALRSGRALRRRSKAAHSTPCCIGPCDVGVALPPARRGGSGEECTSLPLGERAGWVPCSCSSAERAAAPERSRRFSLERARSARNRSECTCDRRSRSRTRATPKKSGPVARAK